MAATKIAFRVYPGKETLYFRVVVHNTEKALHSAIRKALTSLDRLEANKLRRRIKHFRAITWSYNFNVAYKSGRRLHPELGEIHFHAGDVTVENVSHEMTHAAMKWALRMKLSLTEDDELVAHAVGVLSQQFYDKAAKLAHKLT
jgi:hypothetical protein